MESEDRPQRLCDRCGQPVTTSAWFCEPCAEFMRDVQARHLERVTQQAQSVSHDQLPPLPPLPFRRR